jgi:DNA-binding CsgD family transcriptional regulator
MAGRIGLTPQTEEALTPRERDVVKWSAAGKTMEDTAAILGISPHTVGEHLKNIRRKLGTRNGAHTVAVAIQRGEIEINWL